MSAGLVSCRLDPISFKLEFLLVPRHCIVEVGLPLGGEVDQDYSSSRLHRGRRLMSHMYGRLTLLRAYQARTHISSDLRRWRRLWVNCWAARSGSVGWHGGRMRFREEERDTCNTTLYLR